MAIAFSGRLASTTVNQVLVTTGALATPKQRMFQAFASAVTATPLEVQWLAADGTTVKWSQIFAVPSLDFQVFPRQVEEINMLANESLRIIAVAASATAVSCSIDYTA